MRDPARIRQIVGYFEIELHPLGAITPPISVNGRAANPDARISQLSSTCPRTRACMQYGSGPVGGRGAHPDISAQKA
jgi:hypothetical protein